MWALREGGSRKAEGERGRLTSRDPRVTGLKVILPPFSFRLSNVGGKAVADERQGRQKIYRLRKSGSGTRRLTLHPLIEHEPGSWAHLCC